MGAGVLHRGGLWEESRPATGSNYTSVHARVFFERMVLSTSFYGCWIIFLTCFKSERSRIFWSNLPIERVEFQERGCVGLC